MRNDMPAVTLVTGGSRGLGEAIVRRLHGDGHAVAFTYLQSEARASALALESAARGVRINAVAPGFIDTDMTAALDVAAIEAFAGHTPQSVPQQIASEFGLSGPLTTLANACSASGFAFGVAIDALRAGDADADAMIVGGADAFSRYGYASFSRLGAIATDVPRPFSAERQGMVPGEGAAMLFLETLEGAQRRGAAVLAEVIGYGESCDAHHITQPAPRGIVQAARAALAAAGIAPQDVSCISAHGTGTQASDQAESAAFGEIFGGTPPPVTAIKSMLGHAMGAATAMECVAAVCSLQRQVLLPAMNHLGPDPQCPVDCVPNQARPAPVQIVLKTASAFGGNNSAVILKAGPGQASVQEF